MISLLAYKLRRVRVSVLSTVLLILTTSLATQAQLGGSGIDEDPGSGMRRGTNTIVGQVLYPSGNQAHRRLTVRLSSVVVGEFSTMTDNDGVFTFRRLREGSYFITVEAGKDFLPGQETVDLYDNRGRTATVQIQLRPKPPTAIVGVINATLAGVPRPALELYNQALASSAKDNKKAVEQLKAALAIHPSFVLALNELGIIYMNLGDLESAVQALSQATKIAPDNFTLHLNLGYILMQMKKVAEAERELSRAIQLTSAPSLAHLYRGRCLISLRKYREAEQELQKVITLGSEHVPMAYRYLGALFNETGNKPRAIESLEKYLSLAPNSKDTREVVEVIKELRAQLPKPE